MDPRGRRFRPGQGDHQYPPHTSYSAHVPGGAPTYPPQYTSNYPPAHVFGDQSQKPQGGLGGPPTMYPPGHGGPAPIPRPTQASYRGEMSPSLPTSAPAYRSYMDSAYGGSTASGSQYVPAVTQRFPPTLPPEQPPPGPRQTSFSMMNPWSMFSSVSKMGQNVQASQEYVSSKVTWFTGGFFLQLFQVDSSYVFKKIVMLMLPYLHQYDYDRTGGRMDGHASVMAPPRSDLYAPDLYIPMLAMFTYVILAACNKFANGLFTTDVVHSMVSWAVVAWGLNYAILWTVMRMMALTHPPQGVELFAYSGYIFVNFCTSILCGWAFGSGIGWHAAWLYTSFCMSVFLIQTFKYYIRRSIQQPGVPGGRHMERETVGSNRRSAHLMLLMGGSQFILAWLMGTTLSAREKTF